MADGPIDIQLSDNISTVPRDKLLDLAKAATTASDAISQLKSGLSNISTDAVAQLTQQTHAASTNLVAQARAMAQASATVDKLTTSNKAASSGYDKLIQGLTNYTNVSNVMVRGMSAAGQAAAQQSSALGGAKAVIEDSAKALDGHSHALGTNYTAQLQLVHIARSLADQMAAGISPIRAFTVEAGRIGQVVTSTGGVGGLFSSIGSLASRFLNPVTVGFGILAAAVIAGVAAFNNYEGKVAEVNGVLQGAGRNVGLISQDFIELQAKAGSAGKISASSAIDLGAALARTGQLSATNIGAITGQAKNLAATLGVSFDAAKEILIKTFSDPAKGIEALDQQLNFLDSTTKRSVNDLIAAGRQQDAIALALTKLPTALANADTATTSWSRAWEAVAQSASNAFLNVGKAIDRASGFSGPKSAPDQVSDLEKQLAVWRSLLTVQQQEADKLRAIGASDAQISALIPTFQATKDRVADLTAQFDKLSVATQAATTSARQTAQAVAETANEQSIGKQIDEITTAARPANKALEDMRARLELLNQRSLATPIADQQAYNGAITDYGRAVLTAISPEAKQLQLNDAQLASVSALTAAQRAALAAQLIRIQAGGQLVNSQELENKAQGAAAVIIAESQKARTEENLQLDREAALVGLVGTQRTVAVEVLNRELAARRAGNAYSPTELAALQARIERQTQLNAVQQQADAIYSASIKPAQDYGNTLIAATMLLNQGKISQEQFNSAVADSKIKMLDAERTMGGGFQSAILSVAQSYNDVSQTMKTGFQGVATDIENSLVDLTTKGKINITDLANQIETEVARMVIRLLVLRPIMNSISSALSGTGLGGFLGAGGSGGAAAAPTPLAPFGGGGTLTVLPAAANGLSMIVQGASGRDRNILPIRVSRGEQVTVQTPSQVAAAGRQGVGNVTVNTPAPIVTVHGAPAGTNVQTSKGSDGGSLIDIFIGVAKDAVAADIMKGGTKLNRAHETRYGLNAARGNVR